MNRIHILLCFFLILFLIIAVSYMRIPDKSNVTIAVSGILQGCLSPAGKNATGQETGGILALGSEIITRRRQAEKKGETFIWVDNGDNIAGTPAAYYTQGEAIARSMSILPIDACVPGNREFDFGKDVLRDLVSGVNFYTSANILTSDGGTFAGISSHRIITTRAGQEILLLGLTPPNTPDISLKRNVEGLVFQEFSETVKKFLPLINRASLTVIVTQYVKDELLENIGPLTETEKSFVVIYNAYDDDRMEPDNFTSRITLIPHHGVARGRQYEEFNFILSDSLIVESSYNIRPVIGSKITPDPHLSKMTNDFRRKIDDIIHEQIGEVAVDFPVDNFRETRLGNLVCELLLSESGAEMAITNSSGMRVGLKKGHVTVEDLHRILPFDNIWVSMILKGSDIVALMERCYEKNQPILQIAGARLHVDRNSRPRVKSLSINGTPVSAEKEYRIVTNSFLADGGDFYEEFSNGAEREYGSLIRKLVTNHFRNNSPITGKLDKRIEIDDTFDESINDLRDKK